MPARELGPGATLGRYVLSDVLGEGAMGTVYRAHDVELRRDVALKVVRSPEDQDPADARRARQRIFREARSAASLEHPNVVRVYDAGEIDEVAFVAMELVSGRSLRTFVDRPTVDFATRCAWLVDVARALAAAHARGIVHRDVKPDNVMVSAEGVIKVLDFGIARAMPKADIEDPATVTEPGCFVGTPHYMAPEQLRGEAVDERADQFAWGVVAFEILTGQTPWVGEGSMLALVSRMLSTPPPSMHTIAPEVPLAVESIVMRALAKRAADRFPSMTALIEAFAPLSEGHAASVPTPRSPLGAGTPLQRQPGVQSETRLRDGMVLSNVAFVVVGDLAITFHTEKSPTDAEHVATLDIMRAVVAGTVNRALTVTLGGVPTARQRKSYNDVLNGHELLFAVVSDRMIVRRTSAILAWFNPKIRSFSRSEMPQALAFLGIPDPDWPEILGRVEFFEAELARINRRPRPRQSPDRAQ